MTKTSTFNLQHWHLSGFGGAVFLIRALILAVLFAHSLHSGNKPSERFLDFPNAVVGSLCLHI